MRLDRNITNPKRGKYALIKLRESNLTPEQCTTGNETIPVEINAIDFGDTEDSDFFVIRLKDKYACPALVAYAQAALKDDPEYASEIMQLADMAHHHPNRKQPD